MIERFFPRLGILILCPVAFALPWVAIPHEELQQNLVQANPAEDNFELETFGFERSNAPVPQQDYWAIATDSLKEFANNISEQALAYLGLPDDPASEVMMYADSSLDSAYDQLDEIQYEVQAQFDRVRRVTPFPR